MQTKIEGLILTKTPYRERDLICKLLLRSGNKVTVIFYGGRGGGSKKKSSELELGHMLKVELRKGGKPTEMYSAKEWSLIWHHQKLRTNHSAFYLLCLYLEISNKISVEEDLSLDGTAENKRIFHVLSNAIFYLEDALVNGQFDLSLHLSMFLAHSMLAQGVYPSIDGCVICGRDIKLDSGANLAAEHGGFVCSVCQFSELKMPMVNVENRPNELYSFIKNAPQLKIQDYKNIAYDANIQSRSLLTYFCYQFNLQLNDLKTLPFLF